MFRKENGVTLVALVITIIVLLILAGVTISMVLGDGSIIDNATTAKTNYSLADVQGKAALAAMTVRASAVATDNAVNSATDKYADFTAANVADAMSALFAAGEITTAATTPADGVFTIGINGVTYTVTVDEAKYSATVTK